MTAGLSTRGGEAQQLRHNGVLWTLLCSAGCAFLVWYPVTNSDIWWHLAAGREMIARGAILRIDPFASTDTLPWIDVHWVFQLVVYGLYTLAGPAGIVAVKCLVFGVTIALLLHSAAQRSVPAVTVAAAGVLVFEMRYLVLARPIVVTLLCMAVFLFILERQRERVDYRMMLLLVPVQLLWVNTQGLFPLGPALVLIYGVGAMLHAVFAPDARGSGLHRGSRLLLWGAGIAAVSLANPWGWRGAVFPLRLLERIEPSLRNIYALNVSENIPLLLSRGGDVRYTIATLVVALVLVVLLYLRREEVRMEHLLLFAVFAGLAFMAQRNVPLFFVVALALGAWYADTLARTRVRWLPLAASAVLVGMALIGGITHLRVLSRSRGCGMLAPLRHPQGAASFLAAHPPQGNLFNSVRQGGYLIWTLYPRHQVFIDGRLIIRTHRFFADYLDVLDNPQLFGELARRHDISAVVLMTTYVDRYLPLARYLHLHRSWELVFVDESSVVFYQRSRHDAEPLPVCRPQVRERLQRGVAERWSANRYVAQEGIDHIERVVALLCGDTVEQEPRPVPLYHTQKEVL